MMGMIGRKNQDMGLVLATLLILVLLGSIIQVREFKGSMAYPNGPSYYNLRIAEELSKDPFLEKDSLQAREYHPNAYHYFLAFFLQNLGESRTIYFAPVLIGIISALLFFRLLVVLGFPKANAKLVQRFSLQ